MKKLAIAFLLSTALSSALYSQMPGESAMSMRHRREAALGRAELPESAEARRQMEEEGMTWTAKEPVLVRPGEAAAHVLMYPSEVEEAVGTAKKMVRKQVAKRARAYMKGYKHGYKTGLRHGKMRGAGKGFVKGYRSGREMSW